MRSVAGPDGYRKEFGWNKRRIGIALRLFAVVLAALVTSAVGSFGPVSAQEIAPLAGEVTDDMAAVVSTGVELRIAVLYGILLGVLSILGAFELGLYILTRQRTFLDQGLLCVAGASVQLGVLLGFAPSLGAAALSQPWQVVSFAVCLMAGAEFLYRYLSADEAPHWADTARYISIGLPAIALPVALFSVQAATTVLWVIAPFWVLGWGAWLAHLLLGRAQHALYLAPGLAVIAVSGMAALFGNFTGNFEELRPVLDSGFAIGLIMTVFAVLQDLGLPGSAHWPEEALEEHQATHALAYAGQGLWDWDLTTGELKIDETVSGFLGLGDEDFAGTEAAWRERIHSRDREIYRNVLEAYADNPGRPFAVDARVRDADGDYRWLRLRAGFAADEEGEAVHCIGTVSDVTSEQRAVERLLEDPVHDTLTGLPNRALFLDRADRLLRRFRDGREGPCALLLIDIDRFKTVNDSLGHAIGDALLIAIARRLESLLRPQDTIARVGGDEFAILLPPIERDLTVVELAEAIQAAFEQPFTLEAQEIFSSASIGIAHASWDHEEPLDLLREAEVAMYRAKHSGKAHFQVYEPDMRADLADHLAIESDLRRALERGEIELHYQPIVSLQRARLAGFEALMRWRHPERGLLMPDEFLRIAEETGMIIDLGRHALQMASQNLAHWQHSFPLETPLFVSVNVSSRQMLRHDLIADVRAALASLELAAGSLKLELTESLVMDNPEAAAHVLHAIRDLGAGLALDDFGTGHSSLSYLRRFPFDTLKIDRSFITALETGQDSGVIIRTIVELAHDLHMDVVAEGAEREDVISLLAELGCEFGQGFHFGAPMSEANAERLVREMHEMLSTA